MSPRHPRRILRELVLSVGAIVGVVCIVLAAGAAFFGLRPLVFQSGSMSPAITTGSLAIARTTAAADLKVGDVVMVETDRGARVTHRVVDVTQHAGSATLVLKGDANRIPDAETYPVIEAPRVLFHLPLAGYAIGWLAGPVGLFVLGAYAMFLLLVLAGGRRRRGGGARKSTRSLTAAVIVVGTGASGLVVAQASPVVAAWTDSASVSGTTVSTYTVPKPVITSCTVTGLTQKTATITWTGVSSPFALDYTATIVETGQSMTVTTQGSNRQTAFSAGLLSTILNQTYTIRITAKLPSPNGTWISASANQPVTIGTLGTSMTCGTAT